MQHYSTTNIYTCCSHCKHLKALIYLKNTVRICHYTGADAGFLKGGANLFGLHAKGGPALGPMFKSLHLGPKSGSIPQDLPQDPLLVILLNSFILIGHIGTYTNMNIFRSSCGTMCTSRSFCFAYT